MFNRSYITSTDISSNLMSESSYYTQALYISIAIWHSHFTYHILPEEVGLQLNDEKAALAIAAGPDVFTALVDVEFAFNSGASGPAFKSSFSYFTVIWGCTFANNHASRFGAALLLTTNKQGGVLIGNTTMVNNAALRGGAIYGDSMMNIWIRNNSKLINNTAASLGGSIHCDSCLMLRLQQSVVTNSTSGEDGGGIYCDACELVQLTEVQLSNNRYSIDCV